jgi:UDP-2,4-diacetamido-2,4,6-trideoxy-beta-L-altropyranose hydrolase
MTGGRIVLRADGDSEMGLGHLARALALADMLAGAHPLAFHTRCRIPSLLQLIAEKATLVSWDDGAPLAEEGPRFAAALAPGDLVVLDGPHFDVDYQRAVKARGLPLVCVDDLHDRPFVADLIVNHAGGLAAADYTAAPGTRFCLGPAYALLRREFLAAARRRRPRPDTSDVLVCLGGADPRNDLLHVLDRAVRQLSGARFQIVLGAGYRYLPQLEERLRRGDLQATLHRSLGADQMVALMERCPTAITAPSTVSFEYASVGGRLFLHQIADNQRYIRGHLVASGLAFDLDGPLPDSAAVARALAGQAAVFDGRSDERLRRALGALAEAS